MNVYEKAKSLGLTGTSEEIVNTLRPITEQPISLAYLMELLNFRGMLRKTDGSGGSERWQGTLQNLKAALVALNMTEYVTSYELWFSHVTNPRQTTWDTRQPQWASAFLAMEVGFGNQPGMPTSEDFEAVAQLGGGRPYITATAADYDALKQAEDDAVAASAARAALHAIPDAAYQTFNNLYNSVKARIESGELTTTEQVTAALAGE